MYQGQKRPMSLFNSIYATYEHWAHYLTPLALEWLSPNSGDTITKHKTTRKIEKICEKTPRWWTSNAGGRDDRLLSLAGSAGAWVQFQARKIPLQRSCKHLCTMTTEPVLSIPEYSYWSPHAPELHPQQLSSCCKGKPVYLEPVLHNRRSHYRDKLAHCN